MTNSDTCIFCEFQHDPDRVVERNDHAYAVRDGYAVTELHTLVIPVRHVEDQFGLTQEEMEATTALLLSQRESLQAEDAAIKGFNIGMNCGETAGQTILDAHIHLIPRRSGDVPNPRGGVRHVIPDKADYQRMDVLKQVPQRKEGRQAREF